MLSHRSQSLKAHSIKKKIDDGWFGHYRIREIPLDLTFYRLEELDEKHLKAGDRLKRLFSRHDVIGIWDALEVPEDVTLVAEDTEENMDSEGDELGSGTVTEVEGLCFAR